MSTTYNRHADMFAGRVIDAYSSIDIIPVLSQNLTFAELSKFDVYGQMLAL